MYFEDFYVGQVNQFGKYIVTEEEIIEFASKYDPQFFHLDHDKAKQSLFGGLCASGWHTAAMFMRMLVDSMPEEHGSLGSPGVEKIKWLKPVYPGYELSVIGTVTACRLSESKPGVGVVSASYNIVDQHEEVVMSVQSNAFFRCKK